MQIGNSTDPGFVNSTMAARSRQTDSTSPGRIEPTSPVDSPVYEQSNVMDIDIFMEAWGSTDGTWDIDASGTVDGQDLGMLLSAINNTSTDADLKSLFDSWGSSDSQWDLNSDGIVDGGDLGIYLQNGGNPQTPPNENNEQVQTVMDFMDAWGTDSPEFDLNQDGVVDGGDLGLLLNNLNIEAQASEVQAFMSAWGTDSTEFDFNNDGIVDGADLGIMLGSHPPENQESSVPESTEALAEFGVLADKLGDALLKRFDRDGDGLVAVEQLPFDMKQFQELSLDDGMIGRGELVEYLNRQATQMLESDPHADLQGLASEWRQRLFGGEIHFNNPFENNRSAQAQKAFNKPSAIDPSTMSAVGHAREVLGSLGHKDSLPVNIAEALGQIQFKGTSAESVLYHLRQELPGGGIEATG